MSGIAPPDRMLRSRAGRSRSDRSDRRRRCLPPARRGRAPTTRARPGSSVPTRSSRPSPPFARWRPRSSCPRGLHNPTAQSPSRTRRLFPVHCRRCCSCRRTPTPASACRTPRAPRESGRRPMPATRRRAPRSSPVWRWARGRSSLRAPRPRPTSPRPTSWWAFSWTRSCQVFRARRSRCPAGTSCEH